MKTLTIEFLVREALKFAGHQSATSEPKMYGVTDGKAVGTYVEQKFLNHLRTKYAFALGNAAKGIDIPDLNVDIKVTSITQPQSSCPYRSARQKIFGLGYSLVVFVYDKTDDPDLRISRLDIRHVVLVMADRTADFQITTGILDILSKDGNTDDLIAFMHDKNLPVDDIEALKIAEAILEKPPHRGYLTISNALQWRLQYGRVIVQAGKIDGILRIK
jgi:hypothetical protein